MNCKKLLANMTRSNLQEKLVALYLRLNGYTTTGLILHSPNESEVEGEIDLIGVRFSGHKQPDRIIDSANEIEIPTDSAIDIIIGEVKGGKNKLQFNESLRLHSHRTKKLFQWLGFCPDDKLDELIKDFMLTIQTKAVQKLEPFPKVRIDNISIRPILFAPDRLLQRDNQPHFINGSQMIDYCWNCFRPETRRETCETNYIAINNWGEQFERLVGYFKNYNLQSPGKITDIYNHFNILI